VSIDYVEAVDAESLAAADTLARPILLAIAARVGSTRLIDNAVFSPGSISRQERFEDAATE
jgi:pantoate--beta-alanine ligase